MGKTFRLTLLNLERGNAMTIQDFVTKTREWFKGELANLGNGLEVSVDGNNWLPVEQAKWRLHTEFSFQEQANPVQPIPVEPPASEAPPAS